MDDYHCGPLPPALHPLLGKFYRAWQGSMRTPAGASAWVVRRGEIVAALCLTPLDGGHWLSGLLVAPSERHRGLATRLLAHVLAGTPGPVWLFCRPELAAFYRRQGFDTASTLPAPLAQRLARYNRHKTLVALARFAEAAH